MQTSFNVLHAGPSVSIQDTGRTGHLRFGVTGSGAMDRVSYAIANAVLENAPDNPAIEISLGGLTLQCSEGSVRVALVGGSFSIVFNDQPLPPWVQLTLRAGDTLSVRPGDWGSWCYLAFAGTVDSEQWLDSYSVHLNSGVCGRPLLQNDVLNIVSKNQINTDASSIGDPQCLRPNNTLRLVPGPQDRFFDDATLARLFETEFTISPNYDRMGMRLSGCKLPVNATLDMPSEPLSRGSLQVPGHGDPICLMADHQTAGGYPKIATLISVDQDALAQHRSSDVIGFDAVTAKDAVAITRKTTQQREQLLESLMQNSGGMTQRLWNHNLISGAYSKQKD